MRKQSAKGRSEKGGASEAMGGGSKNMRRDEKETEKK